MMGRCSDLLFFVTPPRAMYFELRDVFNFISGVEVRGSTAQSRDPSISGTSNERHRNQPGRA